MLDIVQELCNIADGKGFNSLLTWLHSQPSAHLTWKICRRIPVYKTIMSFRSYMLVSTKKPW